MIKIDKVSISQRISMLMSENKVPQRVLAEKTGQSQANISHFCTGKQVPQLEFLMDFINIFNTNLIWIVFGVGKMKETEYELWKKLSDEKPDDDNIHLKFIKDMMAAKDEKIDELNRTIGRMEEQLKYYRQQAGYLNKVAET